MSTFDVIDNILHITDRIGDALLPQVSDQHTHILVAAIFLMSHVAFYDIMAQVEYYTHVMTSVSIGYLRCPRSHIVQRHRKLKLK